MASYTTSLRLVQPATGEYSGTWGTQVNTGLTALVDTSVAGTATITMVAADYTLSTANGASDEARAAILNVTGTPGAARNIIVPAVSKLYIVYNNTTGGFAQTVKTSAGTGISVPNGSTAYLRCDGTNVVAAVNYLGSLTLGAALAAASGGTGQSSYTVGDLLYASGATALSKLADVATGNSLISGGVGVAPSWGKIGLTTHVSGTLAVGNGGTGGTTFTANNVLLGNGTSAFQVVAPGTNGNVLQSNGTTWVSAAVPSVTTISFGTTGLTPSTATSGVVSVAGTLVAANGGTGQSTYAVGDILYASTTTALSKLAGVATGNALISGGVGVAPSWGKIGLTTHVSGTLPVANGGTNGTATPTAGAVAYGTGTAYAFNTAGTSGQPLLSGGAAAPTFGTLSVAGGGTGATTLTGVLKGNGTSAFTAATAGTDYVAPATATTFTAKQTFSGSTSVLALRTTNAAYSSTSTATAATGVINFDITTQSFLHYTNNASGNWTINFRASGTTSLDTAMSVGEIVEVTFASDIGVTARWNSSVQVDGSTLGVTTLWLGGSAPSSGNINSTDVYNYKIMKTASATFTIFASQTQYG